MYKQYEAIILADENTERMGDFTPMLPLGESYVLDLVIQNMMQAGIDKITVVVGFHYQNLIPLLVRKQIPFVVNAEYENGDTLTSIKAGMKGMAKEESALIICKGNVPMLAAYTMEQTMLALEQCGKKAVVPVFKGQTGRMWVLDASLKEELSAYEGDFAGFLKNAEDEICYLEVPNRNMLIELNGPEDYFRLKMAYKKKDIPDADTCEDLFAHFNVSDSQQEYAKRIADQAVGIAQKVNEICKAEWLPEISTDILQAAALLCNIAGNQSANVLRGMGYEAVAWVVDAQESLYGGRSVGVNAETLLYLSTCMAEGNTEGEYYKKGMEMLEMFLG